eukprot:6480402-Amphidinium_carterae.1
MDQNPACHRMYTRGWDCSLYCFTSAITLYILSLPGFSLFFSQLASSRRREEVEGRLATSSVCAVAGRF